MTLKTFRDAFLAARFLADHDDEVCGTCQRHGSCLPARSARLAVDKADTLLDIEDTREARKLAWLHRSPSRR
jgi:hypothetical protein